MKIFLKKARFKCRHCGNIVEKEFRAGQAIEAPGFCECRYRDYELDYKNSEFAQEDEKITSPLFNQKAQNILGLFTNYEKIAELFYEHQPFFYSPEKIWWIWNTEKKVWQRIDDTDIINAINESIEGLFLFKNNIKNEILNALKMVGRRKQPAPFQKHWIQCGKKIYDLKTHIILDATPAFFGKTAIPWNIENSQSLDTPNIDRLFHDWVPEEYVQLLYEICAYCMLPDYPLRRTFFLIGEGANGKSSYLHIIENLVGKENVCSTDFFSLINNRFETSKIYGKLVCQLGEISHRELKDTQMFKKLTGGDLIRIEFKGKDCFDAYNYAKLVIATNKLPESPDKSKGYFDRWVIIDFNRTFEEKNGLLDCISNEEYEALARKCLLILSALLKKGKFTGEGNSREKALKYEERATPFNDFLKIFSKEMYDGIPFWVVFEEYASYCAERKFRKPSRQETARLLRNTGYTIDIEHFEKENGERSTRRIVRLI